MEKLGKEEIEEKVDSNQINLSLIEPQQHLLSSEEFLKILKNTKEEKKTYKIILISDTHTRTDNLIIPDGDILIHAGDFTFAGKNNEIIKFNNWLGTLPHKYKIVIAGNHEIGFDHEKQSQLLKAFTYKGNKFGNKPQNYNLDFKETKKLLTNCIYLEHEFIEIEGIKIFGTPYQPVHLHWAFNREPDERKILYSGIPTDIDILITHSPPYKILDLIWDGVSHVGCSILLKEVIERIKPKLHVFGHIHESNGRIKINETTFINAAICNIKYKPINKYHVYEYVIN